MKKIKAKPETKETSRLYKVARWLLWFFYRDYRVEGAENLPDGAALIVGNHSQMHGPIACEFYFPSNHHTWCAGQMMKLKDVPAYAYADFWSQKPPFSRPFYKLLSYLIAPLAVLVFNNANTIPVYRDNRIAVTLKKTLRKLAEGAHVIVFPEQDGETNGILYEFQSGFVDVGRLYHKRFDKELPFVPLYIAPNRKTMYIGKATQFNPNAPIEAERERICAYLTEEITAMAKQLPLHTVVPYRNVPKRLYPTNKPKEDVK
ncbi:MAG: 1-acyl-sn-glycerol-3-phosphate acyltransferase [Clostridia bacterium]|nr:1-acyl-sn-glycerol-3-phosphate acyltransferase [Clostridia bacterium]